MDYYNTGSDTPYSYLLLAPHELGGSTWLVFCGYSDALAVLMHRLLLRCDLRTLLSDVSLAAHTEKVLAES